MPVPEARAGRRRREHSPGSSTDAPKRKPAKPKKKKPYSPPRVIKDVKVTSVIDGDTVNARTPGGGYVRVHLIGIDAPASSSDGTPECGGDESADALETFRADHPIVWLVTDPSLDRYDEDGQLRAYVEPDDGSEFSTYQTFMLTNGWAEVIVDSGKPFRRMSSFYSAEGIGSDAGTGVYALCGDNFHLPLLDA